MSGIKQMLLYPTMHHIANDGALAAPDKSQFDYYHCLVLNGMCICKHLSLGIIIITRSICFAVGQT